LSEIDTWGLGAVVSATRKKDDFEDQATAEAAYGMYKTMNWASGRFFSRLRVRVTVTNS